MKPSKTIFIYALCDPETGEVKYIGKTNNPRTRYGDHLGDWSASEKTRWIAQLKFRDLKPKMEILEEFLDSELDWREVERFWIRYWRFLGANLVNGTDGNNTRPETPAERSLRREMGKIDNAHTIITDHLFDHGDGIFTSDPCRLLIA